MTLTVNIPANLDPAQREHLAFALYEAQAVSVDQAAALAGVSPAQFLSGSEFQASSPRQGSPEWKALLRRPGPARGVSLSLEATSREAIYESNAL